MNSDVNLAIFAQRIFGSFGRQKSRDLICIYQPAKHDKICKPISLKTFEVNVVKALEDRPPTPPPP